MIVARGFPDAPRRVTACRDRVKPPYSPVGTRHTSTFFSSLRRLHSEAVTNELFYRFNRNYVSAIGLLHCVGRDFLASARKSPKNRQGEALRNGFRQCNQIVTFYPAVKAPSPCPVAVPEICCSPSFAKFRPRPLLFARFIRHRRRSQTSPLQRRYAWS